MSVNKEVIGSIRKSFLAEDVNRFDTRDVEKVETNDWAIERFVLSNKSEDSALKALIKAMEWRKSFGVNDSTDVSFPQELYSIGWFCQYCKDKEGRPVIWCNQKVYHKTSAFTDLLKQFLVYQFERIDSQTSNQGWILVSDSTDSGLSNMDMDLSKFMVDVLQNYYPCGPKYMLSIDLPWVLNATVKLILAFMNEQLKSTVKLIKQSEALEYIDPAYMPVHLGGTYDKSTIAIPSGAKPLDQFSQFTSDQIKKFYSNYKSDLK